MGLGTGRGGGLLSLPHSDLHPKVAGWPGSPASGSPEATGVGGCSERQPWGLLGAEPPFPASGLPRWGAVGFPRLQNGLARGAGVRARAPLWARWLPPGRQRALPSSAFLPLPRAPALHLPPPTGACWAQARAGAAGALLLPVPPREPGAVSAAGLAAPSVSAFGGSRALRPGLGQSMAAPLLAHGGPRACCLSPSCPGRGFFPQVPRPWGWLWDGMPSRLAPPPALPVAAAGVPHVASVPPQLHCSPCLFLLPPAASCCSPGPLPGVASQLAPCSPARRTPLAPQPAQGSTPPPDSMCTPLPAGAGIQATRAALQVLSVTWVFNGASGSCC